MPVGNRRGTAACLTGQDDGDRIHPIGFAFFR
jgi:hypothetical protein